MSALLCQCAIAGLCSHSVKQATVVNWMTLGVYFTRELLHKMKKIKTPACFGCIDGEVENLEHLILHCSFYSDIREKYLPQLVLENSHIGALLNNEDMMILSILDPLSSKLPEVVTKNLTSPNKAYQIARQFCYNLHQKREKLYR